MVSSKTIAVIKFLRREKIPLINTQLLKSFSGLKNPISLAGFINSLVKNGILEPAEKGKYLVKDNLANDFTIANLLYKPSYVSLETALNLHGILSQFPYEISSITSKRKQNKIILEKNYIYYHIDSKLFWGFEKQNEALIALPEKALLDTIYFAGKGIRSIDIDNLSISKINKKTFWQYSQLFPQTKTTKILIKMVMNKKKE